MKSITKYAPVGANINASSGITRWVSAAGPTPPIIDHAVAWNGTSNCNATDGGYATNDFGGTNPSFYDPLSKWLYQSQFKFFDPGDANILSDFPSNGTVSGPILGIEVTVVRHEVNFGSSANAVGDYDLGLITPQSGGAQLLGSPTFLSIYQKTGGGQYPTFQYWPNIDQPITYGNSSDLWGRNWTPAELNDPKFGFGLLVANFVIGGNPDYAASISRLQADVDSIKITVYYNAAIFVVATGGVLIGWGGRILFRSCLCLGGLRGTRI